MNIRRSTRKQNPLDPKTEGDKVGNKRAISKFRSPHEKHFMKLIDETIDLLGDASEPLGKAFIKAQIISHKLQDKEFSQWVRNEIQGYGSNDEIPMYRTSPIIPHGTLENGVRRYNKMPLPTRDIPENFREKALTTAFYQSISVIEEFAQNSKQMTTIIDQRMYPFLRAGIDPSYSIVSAWGELPAGVFTQILNEARSRLLDLLLNLSDHLPKMAKEDDLNIMPKIDGLHDMFKGAVFGDGANINLAIGNGNQASNNSTSVVKNDIDSLVRELTNHKVSTADIAELQKAIAGDADQAERNSEGFGEQVRIWFASMIVKAGTPAWEIPAQMAAGLLTSALTKFYGI